ncbi:DNA oxidative demethylase ALKBH2 (Alkylated DNA repair protein alkB homolog 2) (Alpha-ketoglutarate-dependent dioxygenase alkB homolog 2), partial [Durusdinium trenchii]
MENGAFPFDLSLAKQPVLEISDSEESRSKKRPLTLTCTPSKKRLFLGGIPGFAETPQDVQALLGPGFANARFAALNESATSWLLLLRRWAPSSEDFDTLWAKHPSSLGKGKLFGKEVTFHRYQQSFGTDYAFSGQVAEAHPLNAEESPEVWHVLAKLRAALMQSSLKDCIYGACLVNWYDGGQHSIGAHSDDERGLVPNAPIFAVSWGSHRIFRVTPRKPDAGKKVEVEVKDGDLIVMGGSCQRTHKHAIPPCKASGRRISLTFRCFQSQQTENTSSQ